MKENKHRNVVNYLDSYLVGESELWVSGATCDIMLVKYLETLLGFWSHQLDPFYL